MALQCSSTNFLPFSRSVYATESITKASLPFANTALSLSRTNLENRKLVFASMAFRRSPFPARSFRKTHVRASKIEEILEGKIGEGKSTKNGQTNDDYDVDYLMDEDERKELRKTIRQVIEMNPEVKEETDPIERRKKMQKLLTDYPLVVEEEDPDWPEDADGRGFSLDQFFDKITIKNTKKDGDDDEDDDNENDFVWQDDDYIRPIKDITSAEWEETVFKDISPLVILVHNRYKRPKQNEQIREELEEAVNIIWNCSLPSPRCVAIDAVVECDLVSKLGVSVFPQLIFTKSGKILHREKEILTADELSKIMAFFYFGAAKPACLDTSLHSDAQIPGFSITT